ncbi:DNA repair exonuclease [Lentisphaerota bacterium WC36G]|nr:DNA repair exonuclease [Lentisphaerae bacterium WC36]
MLKFIHCADLHLNRLFKNINISRSDIREKLTNATKDAWNFIIESAIKEKVDFVAICGDIFDSETPDIATQIEFVKSLRRLNDYQIKAFIVTGNHDPFKSWSSSLNFSANVTIFQPSEVNVLKLINRNNQHTANIFGYSFLNKQQRTNVVKKYYKYIDDNNFLERDVPNIGLLHCDIVGVNGTEELKSSPYAPTTVAKLNNKSYIDYWALGHIHQTTEVLTKNCSINSIIIYPGIMQGRSANDQGDKGFYVISYDGNKTADKQWKCEFKPSSTVNYYRTEISLDFNDFELSFSDLTFEEKVDFLARSVHEKLIGKIKEKLLNNNENSRAKSVIFRCALAGRLAASIQDFFNDFDSEILDSINQLLKDENNEEIDCYLEKFSCEFQTLHDFEDSQANSKFHNELADYFIQLSADLNNHGDLLKNKTKMQILIENCKFLQINTKLKKQIFELLDDDDVAKIIESGRVQSFNYILDEEE